VHPEFFNGGLAGVADPEAIYDLCLILKLCYENHQNQQANI